MTSKSKLQKKSKAVFTILADRLCQDSSQNLLQEQLGGYDTNNLALFQFPLDYELQQIHQSPQAQQLSAYIKYLESQVKDISNKLELQYNQARQTVLFIGQSTSLSKQVSRKKIDEQFQKMGIVRKYDPKLRQKDIDLNEVDQIPKDVGEMAVDKIKRKIQVQWEADISDEMEKERRRVKQAERKKQKELEQIDKDFEKIMKKRKAMKDLQQQVKSQQSMKSVQNGDSSSNRTPKKTQKRQKSQRRASQRQRQRNGLPQSQQQSSSQLNSINNQLISQQQQSSNLNNMLQPSNSNQWNHGQAQLPAQQHNDSLQFEDPPLQMNHHANL